MQKGVSKMLNSIDLCVSERQVIDANTKHISKMEADSCGSERYVCICGTHYNTNPIYPTNECVWLLRHSRCDIESLGDKINSVTPTVCG